MAEIPWGQKESEILEFKGRDALKDLFSIGREVVAMLNATGGEIWVGVKEEQGRAVAPEPIDKPEIAGQRVQDYLVDSIEPRLGTEEVRIDEVSDEAEGVVLRLVVRPRDMSQPYALLKQTGRHFLRRFGDRVVTMSREELLRASKGQDTQETVVESAIRQALEWRKKAKGHFPDRFWLFLRPAEKLEIDIQDRSVLEMLQVPARTGNRAMGWGFAGRLVDHWEAGRGS